MLYLPAVNTPRPIRCAYRPVDVAGASPTIAQLIDELGDAPGLVVLESAHECNTYGRWSIVSFDPVRRIERGVTFTGDPFAELEGSLKAYRSGQLPIPFAGGWIGAIGYECGRLLERLPGCAKPDLDLPAIDLGLYDTVLVQDRVTGCWFVAGIDLPIERGGAPTSLVDRMDQFEAVLEAAAKRPCAPVDLIEGVPTPSFDEAHYLEQVRAILAHIQAGDVYQANLTARFDIPSDSPVTQLYRRLCQVNPANYAALMRGANHAVLSVSPELFLEVRGDAVLTRPIKGTRPRSLDPIVDAAMRSELRHSAKDLAELAMIVDLERNDLSRVCSGVRAAWPPQLEAHPTVHHLVTDVRGCLDPGYGLVDLLRATCPGGSVTGCPKIRAMEIIDGLEPVARGPYCGALGWIGFNGAMTLNLAIRTMIVRGATAYVHVGGGIVADSVPSEECREIFAKAAGMFQALGIDSVATEKVDR